MRIPFLSRKRSRKRSSDGWLRPETKKAILGVVLLVFSLIVVLSFFDAAGPTGQWLLKALRVVFGWLAYVSPILAGWIGYRLVRPSGEEWPRLRLIGFLLLIVGLLGSFHLVGVTPEDAYQVALEGKGGGALGFMLSFPLGKALSPIASLIIFIGAAVIGVFLTFDLSPGDVWEWLSAFIPSRGEEEESEESYEEEEDDDARVSVPRFRVSSMRLGKSSNPDPDQMKLDEAEKEKQDAEDRARKQMKAANKRYRPPSLDLLHLSSGKPNSGNVEENKKKIKSALENFGINVAMGKVSIGPTVTQYTLRPEQGIKLARITALQNDLALALAAHPIRIEAPIPNTDLVGIEIPNKDVSLVRLRDLLASKAFKSSDSPLTIGVGKDVSGAVVADTIEKMPHMLIAGATGSGKSIFINTLLLSLLYRNSPSLVRLILVDPKRVELSLYNDIPHLLTPVIVDSEKTINALKWAVREMDRRYKVLSEVGARSLVSYNSGNPEEALPMIVIVIDELADLMAKHAREVEGAIVRLSQMARAVGIHLVLATQRPSVNVITGLIKANIPTRIAFNVASQVDSRTILDASGAEKLLGSGDMLYLRGDRAKPMRLQGSFVSEEEVHAVVDEIKNQNEEVEFEYDEEITKRESGSFGGGDGGDEPDDDLFEDAKNLVIDTGKASASLLQRRLRVGYARAARLLDMLEEQGVIGPQEGNKPREILVDEGNFEEDGEEYDDEEYDDDYDDSEDTYEDSEERQW